MKSITIVIPAFNEEERIANTLKAVKEIKNISKIIVVNDGSTDNTSDICKNEQVEVIDLNPNRGKGGALNTVIPIIDTDIVVLLDADLGSSALEAAKIIEPVLNGETDLCIASFPPPTIKGGFGIVKNTAKWILKKIGKFDSNAPLSGQRAMTLEVFKSVTPFKEGYGVELGMTINALLNNFRVMEVPTTMSHNETGRNLKGFKHRGKQFIDVIKVIYSETRGKGI